MPVDGETALCGRNLADLASFEGVDFEAASFMVKCRTCQAAALDGPT